MFTKTLINLKNTSKSHMIKLIPDTTVPIPQSVKSEIKYKPKKIEFNIINRASKSIPTLRCIIVPNKENMNKPRIIINSHTKEQQFKLILDTGSNVSLINKRLITKEIRNHIHKTKAKINFPLLDVKEEFVEQINIQINNDIHTFFLIELDIIDVLFDKLIKLNNSTYKITYQQSDQLECNVKAPRKHIPVSNDHQQSQSNNLLDDDDDKNEQVAKFVEGIPSQICDILVKSNPVDEEIQLLRDYINDSLEDVIFKDQDVEPTKKQIYYSTDQHKRHVDEMVLKFIDLDIIKRMVMGYFQVLINPENSKYTAFITHIGKFEYIRMPQGLVNSPSTFARLMVEIFGKIKT
ncbi:hypothetical protein ACTFIZ_012318 [Dictyostelium cf. discoideum]